VGRVVDRIAGGKPADARRSTGAVASRDRGDRRDASPRLGRRLFGGDTHVGRGYLNLKPMRLGRSRGIPRVSEQDTHGYRSDRRDEPGSALLT
jgi:hypothetical protein